MTASTSLRFAACPLVALALWALVGCERRPATPPAPSTTHWVEPAARALAGAGARQRAQDAGDAGPRLSAQSDN
jgi:hypothetical protein